MENGANKPDNSSAYDDFWDISKLVPEKKKTQNVPHTPPTPVAVMTGDVEAESGVPIPKRNDEIDAGDEVVCEYDLPGWLSHVRISKLSGRAEDFSRGGTAVFYNDICRLWRKKCAPCRRVAFFSYMPSYRSMNTEQMKFYLYFRDRARHGEYIDADYSYVLMYLYEIINIGDILPAKTGARLIALIWRAYRDMYPALDMSAGEWLCDYCLINGIPLPTDITSSFASQAAKNLKNADLYFPSPTGSPGFDTVMTYSPYSYKKSKYYAGNEELFDTHVPAAASEAAKAFFVPSVFEGAPVYHTVSRSYVGALNVKCSYKIEVECRSARRSKKISDGAKAIIRACENGVRAYLGVRSILSRKALPDDVLRAIKKYFDENLAASPHKKKTDESEEYLKLYEPDNTGTADISRALDIERDAWQTAIELEAEELEEDPAEIVRTESAEPSGLSDTLKKILKDSLDESFTAVCRREGINPTEAERLINEAAYDIIGDALIEDGELIEDYREEVLPFIEN